MRFFTPIINDPTLSVVPKEYRLLVITRCESYFRRSAWRSVADQIVSGLCFSFICLAVLAGLLVGFFQAGFWGALGFMTIGVAIVTIGFTVFFQYQLRRRLHRYLQTGEGQSLLRGFESRPR